MVAAEAVTRCSKAAATTGAVGALHVRAPCYPWFDGLTSIIVGLGGLLNTTSHCGLVHASAANSRRFGVPGAMFGLRSGKSKDETTMGGLGKEQGRMGCSRVG